jgi:hypothetical protein
MANFIAGNLYSTDGTAYKYATRRSLQTNNTKSPNIPSVIWSCRKVTKTFATFLDETNTLQIRRIRRDDLGFFVYTDGKFSGAPVLRAEFTLGPDTLWNPAR